MRIQKNSKSMVCCFMACVAGSLFLSMSNQANADITYTVTGFANNGLFADPASPVGTNEAYTAVFEIDSSAVDSNDATGLGVFNGAIISSNIIFAEGFISTVDFAGGNVIVQPSNPFGGITLQTSETGDSAFLGSLLLTSQDPFGSDALLTSPQEIVGLGNNQSLFSLTEGTATITSVSAPETNALLAKSTATNGPIVLTVSTAAVPEPSSMALLGLGLVIASARRRKS